MVTDSSILTTDIHARSDIDDLQFYSQFNPGKKWSTEHCSLESDYGVTS